MILKKLELFNIPKFLIVGGSWGSTLSIKYAQKFPENVIGILLRSVFLGTMEEIDWAFINGPKILHQTYIKNSKVILIMEIT